MKRRKPLKRGAPPKRSTKPISPRKADKSKRRFANLRDEAYQGWIRQQPCSVATNWWTWMPNPSVDCKGRTECAHVKSRGAGGSDRGNCVALCTKHHRFQHTVGIKQFNYDYDIDLAAVAAALDVQYQESR